MKKQIVSQATGSTFCTRVPRVPLFFCTNRCKVVPLGCALGFSPIISAKKKSSNTDKSVLLLLWWRRGDSKVVRSVRAFREALCFSALISTKWFHRVAPWGFHPSSPPKRKAATRINPYCCRLWWRRGDSKVVRSVRAFRESLCFSALSSTKWFHRVAPWGLSPIISAKKKSSNTDKSVLLLLWWRRGDSNP